MSRQRSPRRMSCDGHCAQPGWSAIAFGGLISAKPEPSVACAGSIALVFCRCAPHVASLKPHDHEHVQCLPRGERQCLDMCVGAWPEDTAASRLQQSAWFLLELLLPAIIDHAAASCRGQCQNGLLSGKVFSHHAVLAVGIGKIEHLARTTCAPSTSSATPA